MILLLLAVLAFHTKGRKEEELWLVCPAFWSFARAWESEPKESKPRNWPGARKRLLYLFVCTQCDSIGHFNPFLPFYLLLVEKSISSDSDLLAFSSLWLFLFVLFFFFLLIHSNKAQMRYIEATESTQQPRSSISSLRWPPSELLPSRGWLRIFRGSPSAVAPPASLLLLLTNSLPLLPALWLEAIWLYCPQWGAASLLPSRFRRCEIDQDVFYWSLIAGRSLWLCAMVFLFPFDILCTLD